MRTKLFERQTGTGGTIRGPLRFATLFWDLVSPGAWLCLALAVAATPAFANGVIGPALDPAALCQAATGFAEQTESLPPGVLHAMGVVESGKPDPETGQDEPWPWTIDANGVGHVYASEQDAIAAARAFQNAGVTSLDIGCLQVNLAQHPHAFASLQNAFAPAENALYAGRFLRRLKTQLGSWSAAIAAYHSQTPALGVPYEQRVLAAWQSAGGPKMALAAPPAIPLPQARQMRGPGKKPAPPGKSPAPPPRVFGSGGFQFSALRGQATFPPVAALPVRLGTGQVGAVPSGGQGMAASPMRMRGLAAYRAAPILIASIH